MTRTRAEGAIQPRSGLGRRTVVRSLLSIRAERFMPPVRLPAESRRSGSWCAVRTIGAIACGRLIKPCDAPLSRRYGLHCLGILTTAMLGDCNWLPKKDVPRGCSYCHRLPGRGLPSPPSAGMSQRSLWTRRDCLLTNAWLLVCRCARRWTCGCFASVWIAPEISLTGVIRNEHLRRIQIRPTPNREPFWPSPLTLACIP